jgi:transposase
MSKLKMKCRRENVREPEIYWTEVKYPDNVVTTIKVVIRRGQTRKAQKRRKIRRKIKKQQTRKAETRKLQRRKKNLRLKRKSKNQSQLRLFPKSECSENSSIEALI